MLRDQKLLRERRKEEGERKANRKGEEKRKKERESKAQIHYYPYICWLVE